MTKIVTDCRRVVFHHRKWLRLLTLSCGHRVLCSPEFRPFVHDCSRCSGRSLTVWSKSVHQAHSSILYGSQFSVSPERTK